MDRVKESLLVLWDVWVLMCTTGMSLLVAFTAALSGWAMLEAQFMRPTAPAPRRVIEAPERIPPQHLPTTPREGE